jgi:IS5 family transposase
MMPGLFDEQFLLQKLDQMGDPLARLDGIVDWQAFLPAIEKALGREHAVSAGRKPYPTLFMFKILIFQSLYNLSDEDTERELLKNLLARRFVGLSGRQFAPDFTTIWRFREALTRAGVIDALHEAFHKQLDDMGLRASKGQIVDASIVPAPKQLGSREENEAVRAGEAPLDWSEAKRRQKDVDARWTKKNEQRHFGYKNHVAVDVKHKFIRKWQVSAANAHDSQVFLELLAKNTSRDVYADSAYLSEKSQERLTALGYRPHIQRKGQKNHPLSDWEKQGNRRRSRIRSRVEHVFGAQLQRAGTLLVRCIGLARASVKIGLRNLAYNMDRLGFLAGAC